MGEDHTHHGACALSPSCLQARRLTAASLVRGNNVVPPLAENDATVSNKGAGRAPSARHGDSRSVAPLINGLDALAGDGWKQSVAITASPSSAHRARAINHRAAERAGPLR
ncbi:hypothetical protein AAFF_G00135880 [Aldrovandia affinis]|uniref:Uncharacterized protein n=1 Tax=Aldrovandia affinis TaxID=143900 RepID=A0AAD7RQ30_9TELE|nr:hypothetical protein AAFF_G00135880 [Aldrovandia affinis]